ncbi:MAG: hypothetical protein IKX14_05495, partial [Neisseriaceae bacterium]|nr:hypothetical protein [Neisseriaceae bacterium]
MLNTQTLISSATERNWQRLNVVSQNKLRKRANKTCSEKQIIPFEYFSDKNNISHINNLLNLIQQNEYDISSVLYSLSINLLKKENIFYK